VSVCMGRTKGQIQQQQRIAGWQICYERLEPGERAQPVELRSKGRRRIRGIKEVAGHSSRISVWKEGGQSGAIRGERSCFALRTTRSPMLNNHSQIRAGRCSINNARHPARRDTAAARVDGDHMESLPRLRPEQPVRALMSLCRRGI